MHKQIACAAHVFVWVTEERRVNAVGFLPFVRKAENVFMAQGVIVCWFHKLWLHIQQICSTPRPPRHFPYSFHFQIFADFLLFCSGGKVEGKLKKKRFSTAIFHVSSLFFPEKSLSFYTFSQITNGRFSRCEWSWICEYPQTVRYQCRFPVKP